MSPILAERQAESGWRSLPRRLVHHGLTKILSDLTRKANHSRDVHGKRLSNYI